jgi:hypothetical protein
MPFLCTNHPRKSSIVAMRPPVAMGTSPAAIGRWGWPGGGPGGACAYLGELGGGGVVGIGRDGAGGSWRRRRSSAPVVACCPAAATPKCDIGAAKEGGRGPKGGGEVERQRWFGAETASGRPTALQASGGWKNADERRGSGLMWQIENARRG